MVRPSLSVVQTVPSLRRNEALALSPPATPSDPSMRPFTKYFKPTVRNDPVRDGCPLDQMAGDPNPYLSASDEPVQVAERRGPSRPRQTGVGVWRNVQLRAHDGEHHGQEDVDRMPVRNRWGARSVGLPPCRRLPRGAPCPHACGSASSLLRSAPSTSS
jgi:hypothetical protein